MLLVKAILFVLWIISILAVFMSIAGMIIMTLLPEEKPKLQEREKPPFYSLDKIEKMAKDSKTDKKQIEMIALSLVEYHPLPPKNNGKTTKEAKHLLEVIFTLSGHTGITKNIRSKMLKDLIKKNPEYKQEFQNAS